MKKRVGFLIDSLTYFKLFGPVIEEALRSGLDVHLLLRDLPQVRKGPKGYQWPDPAKIPAFSGGEPRVHQWRSDESLLTVCEGEGLEAVFSVWLFPRDYALCRALRARGVRWVALQHGTEYLVQPAPTLLGPDATCMFSSFWIDRAVDLLGPSLKAEAAEGASVETLRAKLEVTGAPELDALKRLDPLAIRRKYSIPADRPVVVWLPHDYHRDDPWEMLVFRRNWHPRAILDAVRGRRWDLLSGLFDGETHAQLVQSLRAFCDRNGAFLVVKSRIKDRPSTWDRGVADLFTFDVGYHPPTILEILAVADLCVHVLSVVVMETAFAGVPSLCLVPPPESSFISNPNTGWRRTSDDFLGPETLWNFPGVSSVLSIRDAVKRLPAMRLEEFGMDPLRREEYVRRFVGPADGRSAARVLRVALQAARETVIA